MRIKPTARPNLRFFIMAPSFPPCHLLPAMCLCVCSCVPNVLLIRLLIVVEVRGFFLSICPTQKEKPERKKECPQQQREKGKYSSSERTKS